MNYNITDSNSSVRNLATSCPSCWLMAALAVCVPLTLLLVENVPIGPNYWDLTLYEDAAHRIQLGQTPNLDFRTPAGSLIYDLYAFAKYLFPGGHPALLASWSILLIALPLFWIVITQLVKDGNKIKMALTLPFVFLSLMPFNSSSYHSVPGIDAFGIYNRHPALLLYILTTLVFFARSGALFATCTGVILLALFLTKITGFVAALPIVIYAALTGRFSVRSLALMLGVLITPLLILETGHGTISSYLSGIIEIASLNSGGIVQRLAFVAATQFDIQIALLAILAILVALDLPQIKSSLLYPQSVVTRLQHFMASDTAWFCTLLTAALAFELQNTGSQEYVFLWPFLLHLLRRFWFGEGWLRIALIIAICFATIPAMMSITHRAARTAIANISYAPLNEPVLGRIGDVTTPSVPMMMRHRPAGSLPLRAEVTASDGYAHFES